MTARVRMTVVAAVATLLASLSLGSVFRDGQWFWQVVAAVAVATGGCALGRRMGLPRLLVPVIGLAGLAVLVTWMYARGDAVLGVLPGPGALRALDQLAQLGFDGMRRYAAPAPTDPGLVLLAAAGVGFVAVVVDTLAVTYRSAALAGIPLLVLYAVPVTVVRDGVPWLLFTVAAIGWMALLLAEGRERASAWGRALDRRSTKGDNVLAGTPPEPLGVVGRRIGAAALGLALVLPAVLPWVTSSLFSRGGGSGSGGTGGTSAFTTIDPFVTLLGDLTAKQDATVLQYRTSDPDPDYLRMITLDSFNGTEWLPARMDAAGSAESISSPEGTDLAGLDVRTALRANGLSQQWLPMPYPVTGISGLRGEWKYDAATRNVFIRRGNSQGLTYAVESRHLRLTPEVLREAGPVPASVRQAYTALPGNVPALARDLARGITAGKSTEYDKAYALQQYFLDDANGFRYNTKLEQIPGNPLVAFLTQKQGYCQQFATAYAVLARAAGLPTRIDIGFTPGSKNGPGSYDVNRTNAHAWPEVYFAGAGWVRFEPTKGGPTGVLQPGWATGPGGAQGPNDPTQQDQGVSRSEHNRDHDFAGIADANPGAEPVAAAAATDAGSFPWRAVLGVMVLLALLAPGVARVFRRRRRLRRAGGGDDASTRVLAAWLEVADTARDLQRPWSTARTPRRAAEWLLASSSDPEALAAARRLARTVERSWYAPPGVDVLGGTDPGADATVVVRAVEAGSARRERWRARVWPASVLSAAARRGADLLDALDVWGARLRASLARRLPSRGDVDAAA